MLVPVLICYISTKVAISVLQGFVRHVFGGKDFILSTDYIAEITYATFASRGSVIGHKRLQNTCST